MFHPNKYMNIIIKVIFLLVDLVWIRKDSKLWIIGIPKTDNFDGNVRALYELVQQNPSIIAPCRIRVIVPADSYTEIPSRDKILWGSAEHIFSLLRAGCVLYHHNYNDVGLIALPLWRWNFRVSHGIHYKRVERAHSVPSIINRLFLATRNIIPHHLVSSRLDALSAVAYFHIYLPRVKITGAAKNDILIGSELPDYYQQQQAKLVELLNGRSLITYAPTWRKNGESYLFSPQEESRLNQFLSEKKAVFGVAGHQYLRRRHIPKGPNIIDLNALNIDVQVMLRCTDTLVTDYSSIWIDFLLKERPIILFHYDYADYLSDRDVLFDMRVFSPSTQCRDFDALLGSLVNPPKDENNFLKNSFHEFEDGRNGLRSLEAIKDLTLRP